MQTDDKKSTRAVASSDSAETSAKLVALETANAALNRELQQILAASTQNADSADAQAPPRAVRHRLPAERASVTHKFGISGHEGYITVGLYPNGSPGEIFIRMAKEGSTVSGLMDSFATAISISLQHGVPLRVLCEKFAHTRFEPSGWTGNPEIGYAKSIMDYIFRWIQIRFLSGHQLDLFTGMGAAASVPVAGNGQRTGQYGESGGECERATGDLRSGYLRQRRRAPRRPHTAATRHRARTNGTDRLRARRVGCKLHRRSRRLPCIGCDEEPLRHGRRTELLHLRSHHDSLWLLLPLHELRQHQRMQLGCIDI